MQFDKIKNPLQIIRLRTKMKYWLSFETEAGQALKKLKLLGSFQHRGRKFYAAMFSMEKNGGHPAGEYIIVDDEYGMVKSSYLAYNPEIALDDAKITADFICDFKENLSDPMFALGFTNGMPKDYKKSPEDIVRRTMTYLIAGMVWESEREGDGDSQKYSTLLDEFNLRDDMFEIEKKIVSGGLHMPGTVNAFEWYAEAVYAVLWAARLYGGDVCYMDVVDVRELYDSMEGHTIEEIAQRVSMRDISSVVDAMKELYPLLSGEGTAAEIAYERLRGLLWLMNDVKDWTEIHFSEIEYS